MYQNNGCCIFVYAFFTFKKFKYRVKTIHSMLFFCIFTRSNVARRAAFTIW